MEGRMFLLVSWILFVIPAAFSFAKEALTKSGLLEGDGLQAVRSRCNINTALTAAELRLN
jgi:hypothetical protein